MNIRYNQQLDSCINNLTMDLVLSGYVQTGPAWKGENIRAPFNRLYIVQSGSGWIQYAGKKILLEPGKAYLIPLGLQISFGCPKKLSKLYFHINLRKPDRYDLLQTLNEICIATLPEGMPETLEKLQSSKTLMDALLLKNHLFSLICRMLSQTAFAPGDISVYSHHVNQTIHYIQQNLSAKLQVSELAEQCFLSQRQLYNLFRKELGVTPGQYLDDQLMHTAQRLLFQTEDSIAAISEELGFADQFYFSRKFKKTYGQTPLQYRKNNRT